MEFGLKHTEDEIVIARVNALCSAHSIKKALIKRSHPHNVYVVPVVVTISADFGSTYKYFYSTR